MTEVISAIHGIAPRSDELHVLATAAEKGRASWDEFAALRDQEAEEWLAWQDKVGIDIPGDSKLHWLDHLRPIVKASTGFAPGIDHAPVTRWFETNTFYRQPTIVDRLRFDIGAFKAQLPEFGKTVSLLGVRDFAELCRNEHTGLAPYENVKQLYRQVVTSLGSLGVERVIFTRYGDNHEPRLRAEASIAQLRDAVSIVEFPTHDRNPYLNLESAGHLLNTTGAELWLGAVNPSTTTEDRLPTSQEVDLLAHYNVGRFVLTNTVDFGFLPLPYAQDKVERLAEITRHLRDKLEVA